MHAPRRNVLFARFLFALIGQRRLAYESTTVAYQDSTSTSDHDHALRIKDQSSELLLKSQGVYSLLEHLPVCLTHGQEKGVGGIIACTLQTIEMDQLV